MTERLTTAPSANGAAPGRAASPYDHLGPPVNDAPPTRAATPYEEPAASPTVGAPLVDFVLPLSGDPETDYHVPAGFQTDARSREFWEKIKEDIDQITHVPTRALLRVKGLRAEGTALTRDALYRDAKAMNDGRRSQNAARIAACDGALSQVEKEQAETAAILRKLDLRAAEACAGAGLILPVPFTAEGLNAALVIRVGGTQEAAGRAGLVPADEGRIKIGGSLFTVFATLGLAGLLLTTFSGITGLLDLHDLGKPERIGRTFSGLLVLLSGTIGLEFYLAQFAGNVGRIQGFHVNSLGVAPAIPAAAPATRRPSPLSPEGVVREMRLKLHGLWIANAVLDGTGIYLAVEQSNGEPLPWFLYVVAGAVISGIVILARCSGEYQRTQEAARLAVQKATVLERREAIYGEGPVRRLAALLGQISVCRETERHLAARKEALLAERERLARVSLPDEVSRMLRGATLDAAHAFGDFERYVALLARFSPRRAAALFAPRYRRPGFWPRLFRRIVRRKQRGQTGAK